MYRRFLLCILIVTLIVLIAAGRVENRADKEEEQCGRGRDRTTEVNSRRPTLIVLAFSLSARNFGRNSSLV